VPLPRSSPATDKAVDRGDLKILAFRNLLLGAGIVPDADFVDDTFEIALGSPRRAHGSSDAGMLDAVKSRRCVCGGFGFEIAVKVNAPRSSIVRGGGSDTITLLAITVVPVTG